MIKYFILFLIVAMLLSLFSGGFFLIKDKGKTKRTAYSLGIRVSIAGGVVFHNSVRLNHRSDWSWILITSHKQKLQDKSKPHPQSANTKNRLQTQIGRRD
ncbi:MAG: hypothetical protein Ct9H300mP20_05760 [Gammaproteobacteria bacterium]|nr:MAG: hypothetical protein Ct9H300mP20_05760 [Gammaproteobacteria bacterium]